MKQSCFNFIFNWKIIKGETKWKVNWLFAERTQKEIIEKKKKKKKFVDRVADSQSINEHWLY